MTLVERAAELSSLVNALHCAAAGNGQVVVVGGPTASGKSELLRSFAHTASETGALLFEVTASRSSGGRPMGVLARLLSQAEPYAPRLRQLVDHAVLKATLDGHEADRADPAACHDADRTAPLDAPVLHELATELAALARRDPVVIMVDDVQYADPASLNALLWLARRVAASRIMLVLTDAGCAGPLGELHRLPQCRRIRLRLLTQEGLAALFAEHLEPGAARAAAAPAQLLTGGNPLLAQALAVDQLHATRRVRSELVVGDRFTRAVVMCLHRTGPNTLRVAQGLALLGGDAPVDLLARLLDTHTLLVSEALSALRAAGLLDGSDFRHPPARAAALETLAPEVLETMHARAAELLYRQGAPAVTIARHLVAAGRADPPWAVEALQDGSEQALCDGELDLALGCLWLAERHCSDESQRATLAATLASIEWRIDPATALRRLPGLVEALRQGLISGRHAALIIGFLLWAGEFETASSLLAGLGSGTRPASDDAAFTSAALSPWLGQAFPEHGHLLLSDPDGDTPHRPLRMLTDPGLREVPTGATVPRNGGTAVRAEQVLAQCEPDDLTIGPIATSLATLCHADQLDKAASWCDHFLQLIAGRPAPVWQALLTAVRAAITSRRGDLRAAESQARRALALLPASGWGVAIGLPLATMIGTTTSMGRLDEAASYLAVEMPPEVFRTSFGLYYLQARGHYHLATGHFDLALSHFEYCGSLMQRWNRDLPSLVAWRSDAALALLATGRQREAKNLLNRQFRLLRPGDRRARGLSLRALAAATEPPGRLPLLREALSLFEATGDRLDVAQVFAEISRTHHELGACKQARATARRARSLALQCGAEAAIGRLLPPTADADPKEADVKDADAKDPATPADTAGRLRDLSDAERRVAGLAALGDSNRQIACKLFISVSAVEQHLTRAYRKLNVRRRTELPWQPSSTLR